MFIPRAVRLKGTTSKPKTLTHVESINSDTGNTASPQPQPEDLVSIPNPEPPAGPKNATSTTKKAAVATAFKPDYLGQLLCGIELIFTDYAHQDPDGSKWLQTHYRHVDGEGKCKFYPNIPFDKTNLTAIDRYPPLGDPRASEHCNLEACCYSTSACASTPSQRPEVFTRNLAMCLLCPSSTVFLPSPFHSNRLLSDCEP